MTPRELIRERLRSTLGDDLARARAAFRGMTPEEMQRQHGESGLTRAQVLAGYEDEDRAVREALAWLERQPD